MASLLIPTRMAEARKRERDQSMVTGATGHIKEETLAALTASLQEGKERVWDIDTPVPTDVPNPGLWRVCCFPIGQRRITSGNIMLPPEELDVSDWTHPVWKIAAVGPFVHRGPAWHGFSDDELEATKPRVGEIWLLDPKQPRRFHYQVGEDKMLLIVINDDQLWCRIEPEQVSKISTRGLQL